MKKHITQPERLFILCIYIAFMMLASKFALGSWLPPTSQKGLWFYAGLGSLLLGNLLISPFYSKPADTISYAVAGLLSLLAVWPLRLGTEFDRALWIIVTACILLVLGAGIISITFKDATNSTLLKLSRSSYRFTEQFGKPKEVFSLVFLFAIIAFHRDTPREYLTIGITWATVTVFTPIERLFTLVKYINEIWKVKNGSKVLGQVVGHHIPGILLMKHDPSNNVQFGNLLVVPERMANRALG
jgi:hypothetical protein